MRNAFETYHPVVNFAFFCMVIGMGIFLIHPVFLGVGTLGALTYGIISAGKSAAKFSLCFLLPVVAVVTVVNPLVNHRGNTVLFYTEYSQITLEATVYGLLAGLVIASVMMWFYCYNRVMTSDKFIYLFGRIIPATSLVFSMVLRFVPNFRSRIRKVSDAQKCAGGAARDNGLKSRLRRGARIMSAMFTWSLENSIDTADSMKARGYGIEGRTSFSIFKMESRDVTVLIIMGAGCAAVLAGIAAGSCSIEFYPDIIMAPLDGWGIAAYAAYGIICFMPAIIQIGEAALWKRSQLKN